jgi:hypothetical protein
MHSSSSDGNVEINTTYDENTGSVHYSIQSMCASWSSMRLADEVTQQFIRAAALVLHYNTMSDCITIEGMNDSRIKITRLYEAVDNPDTLPPTVLASTTSNRTSKSV